MMPKDVKCKYCNKLKNHWCKAVLDSPDEDITRECRHFIHKTNADRIRAMSDEELAVFFHKRPLCPKPKQCEYDCSICWLEWLQQPVGDDNDL